MKSMKTLLDILPVTASLLHPDPELALEKEMEISLLFPRHNDVIATSYNILLQFMRIELSEVVSTIQNKLPKLWSKVRLGNVKI